MTTNELRERAPVNSSTESCAALKTAAEMGVDMKDNKPEKGEGEQG